MIFSIVLALILQAKLEIAVLILTVVVIALLVIVLRQEMRLQKLLRGKDARTLEDTIRSVGETLDVWAKRIKEAEEKMNMIQSELRKTVSGIGTVRFNPFKGTSGSNQSFATAFMNKEGKGVVISTLYSRERVSIFAKPLENNASQYELSHEEKEAVEKAKNNG